MKPQRQEVVAGWSQGLFGWDKRSQSCPWEAASEVLS